MVFIYRFVLLLFDVCSLIRNKIKCSNVLLQFCASKVPRSVVQRYFSICCNINTNTPYTCTFVQTHRSKYLTTWLSVSSSSASSGFLELKEKTDRQSLYLPQVLRTAQDNSLFWQKVRRKHQRAAVCVPVPWAWQFILGLRNSSLLEQWSTYFLVLGLSTISRSSFLRCSNFTLF